MCEFYVYSKNLRCFLDSHNQNLIISYFFVSYSLVLKGGLWFTGLQSQCKHVHTFTWTCHCKWPLKRRPGMNVALG